MPESPPKASWLFHPAFLACACGLLGFLFAAVASPPPALVAIALSLPFFYFAAESRWKDCIAWTIATMPLQYYFEIGGLTLTITEMYFFVFVFAFSLSKIWAERSFLVPSLLIIPLWYGLSQLTPAVAGHFNLVKHAVRTLIAVFFCPRPYANRSRVASYPACWPRSL